MLAVEGLSRKRSRGGGGGTGNSQTIGQCKNEPPTKRSMEFNPHSYWMGGRTVETVSASHWSGTEIGGTNDDRVDVCAGSNARAVSSQHCKGVMS